MELKYLGHQGDVVIMELLDEAGFPAGEQSRDTQTQNGILAYGELSGHAHQFTDLEAVDVFRIKDEAGTGKFDKLLFIQPLKDATLVHGRARDFVGKEADHDYHKALTLRTGRRYVTGIVEETDWLTRTIKRVVD